ncbi:MAG TPA: serine hydrolase, partial [Rhizomicrobium sp.]
LVPLWGPKTIGADGALVYNPSWEFTGGGLVSTSADLAFFMKMLFEGRIVGAAGLAEMREGWPMEMGALLNHRYGLGVQMFDSALGRVIGHSGQFAGYRSLAFYFQDNGTAMAMQTNADVEGLMPTFMRLAAFAHGRASAAAPLGSS